MQELYRDIEVENKNPIIRNNLWEKEVKDISEVESRYYIRITVEDIACETGLGYSKVSALTAMLEVDGFIQIDLLQRCVITR